MQSKEGYALDRNSGRHDPHESLARLVTGDVGEGDARSFSRSLTPFGGSDLKFNLPPEGCRLQFHSRGSWCTYDKAANS